MYYLGLDLGQAADYTALAIIQKLESNSVKYHHLVHLQRFPLGTGYPEIVQQVREMGERRELSGKCTIVADATGVGRPVIDLFVQGQIPTIPITITGGNVETFDGLGGWHVPKRNLVSMLQVLLQTGRLKIAQAITDTRTLVDELLAFRVKVTSSASDTYEAWREGDHDDLVLAVALAAWYSERFGVAGFQVYRHEKTTIELLVGRRT
jgi:hypothetical protein